MHLLFLFETDESAESAATCMGIGLEEMDDIYGMSVRVADMKFAIEIDQETGMWGLFADAPSQSDGLLALWKNSAEGCPLRDIVAGEILFLGIVEDADLDVSEIFNALIAAGA